MTLEAVNGVYQVARNSGVTLQTTFEVDGAPTDADGAVTVTIVRANGTVLVNGQNATHVAPVGSGKYTFLFGPQSRLDALTVTWAGVFGGVAMSVVEQVDVVGGFVCTLDELQHLPNTPTTTDEDLLELRRDFEDLAERYVGVALVPRFQRDELEGRGRTHVQLTRLRPRSPVLAVTVNGAAATDLTGYSVSPHGRLANVTTGFPAPTVAGPNVIVEYEHGLDAPPASIRRCEKAYIAFQIKLAGSAISGDVLYETDAAGLTTRYSTPDWDAGRPTGLLHVDNVLNAMRRTIGLGT